MMPYSANRTHRGRRVQRAWLIVGAVLVSLLAGTVAVWAGTLELAQGVALKVQFVGSTPLTSNSFQVGDRVPIQLVEPVYIGTIVVIPAGAPGIAEVILAEKSGKGGKPGKIQLKFIGISPNGDYKLVDADLIPLQDSTDVYEGGGKKLLSYLLIAGLFIKGGQGEVPMDKVFEVHISETVRLESE